MWLRFTHEHWHRFNPQFKTRFLPGQERNLPTSVAEKAIRDGNAIKLRKKSRHAKPEPDNGAET